MVVLKVLRPATADLLEILCGMYYLHTLKVPTNLKLVCVQTGPTKIQIPSLL
jgi:hypothetical protein